MLIPSHVLDTMDNTKRYSSEQNPEETFSSAGLDRAFFLSSSESFLLNDADDSKTRTDESLLGDDTGSKQITNRDNDGFSDSTSYFEFPRACAIFHKSVKGPTVSLEAQVSDCDGESCSRVSSEEPDTESSPESIKNKTLSKLLAHMIQTILKKGSKESKTTEKVVTSYLSSNRDTDNNICHSPREKERDFSSSLGIASSVHLVNDGEDFADIDTSLKLTTIVEGTDESASNLSNGHSPDWSRMYLGKLRSFPPVNNLTYDAVTTNSTYVKNDSDQKESDINGFTLSDVDTSRQSFGTFDNYFDTIDSDIQPNLEDSGSEYYASASELSTTEERFGEIANDTTESTFDNYNKGSIASKISNSFSLVKKGNLQTSLTPSGLKSKVQGYKEETRKLNKSFLSPVKKKKRFSRSSKDTTASPINISPYNASGKDNPCTPIRGTKGYALQKAHQFTESAKKNTPRSRITKNNSPRLSDWRSPVVVTSSIKPVKFLRNLFHSIEKKNRRDLGRPRQKIAKPEIIVTPASPSYNLQ